MAHLQSVGQKYPFFAKKCTVFFKKARFLPKKIAIKCRFIPAFYTFSPKKSRKNTLCTHKYQRQTTKDTSYILV